jgi:hypothetical protein
LIPLHFNSFRSNTYKKPGGGCPPQNLKVSQLVTPRLSPGCASSLSSPFSPFSFKPSTLDTFSLSPFLVYPEPRRASLLPRMQARGANSLQIAENKTTLCPSVATLTHSVTHKSFVCHSYKNHRGVGGMSIPWDPKRLAIAQVSREESGVSVGFHGARTTDRRPCPFWHPSTVAPQPAKCQNHACCCFAGEPRETFRSSRCLIHESGHRARHPQNASPVARRFQANMDRTSKKAWVQRSKVAF